MHRAFQVAAPAALYYCHRTAQLAKMSAVLPAILMGLNGLCFATAWFFILGVSAYSMRTGDRSSRAATWFGPSSYFHLNQDPRRYLAAVVERMPPAEKSFFQRVQAAHLNQLDNLPFAMSAFALAKAYGVSSHVLDSVAIWHGAATIAYIIAFVVPPSKTVGFARTTFFAFRMLAPGFILGNAYAAWKGHPQRLSEGFVGFAIQAVGVNVGGAIGIWYAVGIDIPATEQKQLEKESEL